MPTCGLLSQGFTNDCDNPKSAGTKKQVILIDKDNFDIATVTRNQYNQFLINNFLMPAGEVGYAFDCAESTPNHKSEGVVKLAGMAHKHSVSFILTNNDATTKLSIKELQQGSFVAIVENEDKGSAGERAYELLGEKNGLRLATITRDNNDDTSAGSYMVELSSLDKTPEPFAPSNIFDGIAYTSTKTIVDTVLIP